MDEGDQILQAIEQWGRRLSGEITEMKADIGTLKSDVGTLKADVAELKSDVAVLKSDVAVLKSDVAVLKSDVAVLKSDVADLKHLMTNVEGEQLKIKHVIGANHLKVMGRIDQLSDQLQSHIRHSA